METWKDVWNRRRMKGDVAGSRPTLRQLMDMDGFDVGPGSLGEKAWRDLVEQIRTVLDIRPDMHVCEVGCGAGAVLLPLSEIGCRLSAIDYSAALVSVARAAVPEADVHLAEACSLPFPAGTFDAVYSFGVFHYFPDLDYAGRVLSEMERVVASGGRILVMDLPDAAKKEVSEDTRRRQGAAEHPKHLYYAKSYFEAKALEWGMSLRIWDQQIEGYHNSPFRFNVLFSPTTEPPDPQGGTEA